MTRKGKSRWTAWLRRLSQLLVALYILVASVRHSTSAEHLPSVDALCPFGGVETLWTLVRTGRLVQMTHPSNLVLAVGLLLGALLAGATFCGWVCPFGAFHDLLSWISRKVRLPQLTVPRRLDSLLTYGRYVTLIGIPAMTVATASLWFAGYDPYRTIFSLGWIFEFDLQAHWPAYLVALLVVVAGLFIPRFWCRYLCPQGVLLGLVQRFSLFAVGRDEQTCIDCKRCDQVCPYRLPVSSSRTVRGDCIGCLECVEACPVPGTLSVGIGAPRSTRVAEAQE